MTQGSPLCDSFRVGERFRRSVNLAADYGSSSGLDDYIVTPLSGSILSRIMQGLKADSADRAWSITGPYGAGKSAAVLFAAEVLGYPVNRRARRLLEGAYPELLRGLQGNVLRSQDAGYVIVPLVGSRESICWTILDGLAKRLSAQDISTPDVVRHASRIRKVIRRAKRGDTLSPDAMVDIIEQAAQLVMNSSNSVQGLIIVYDELGRALEYAALHPERSDVGILQTVAELAARSAAAPVGLVTILHQAFEHYASDLNPVQQREWAKIQGRFNDIGFVESHGGLLRLIDKAVSLDNPADGLIRTIAAEAQQAKDLGILPSDVSAEEGVRALAGCAPLHPTVALILGRLFRSSLSQNERSLFAFLSSGEPYGFQEYLGQETWSDNGYRPFYRVDALYDYIAAVMGSVLFTQLHGKRWAEIEEALHRLPREATVVEAQLVKAIGLLSLLGDQRRLKASEEILVYALADGHTIDRPVIQAALAELENQGLVVYRRFKKAYGLWEGSDVDLNQRFEHGLTQVDRSQSVASLLQNWGRLKPYVAKRHLHETGTFRYFVPWLVDFEELDTVRSRLSDTADGAVVFILGANGWPVSKILSTVKRFSARLDSPRRELLFFAVPRDMQGIKDALVERLAWDWVAENSPELEGDSVARRELRARRLAVQERLGRITARCFEAASAYAACRWVWKGEEQRFDSARALAASFSQACDEGYHAAPIVHNELANRRDLSSAASAARRNLVSHMLAHADEARLGIRGYPPEASIYLSVLERSGLHRQCGDKWVFGIPESRDQDQCHVLPMWRAIDAFLAATEEAPRPVTDLYDLLRDPPFGIKDGLLPIYLVVAMLYWQAELALYEEGSFVPSVGPAACERLMRVPERFSLQSYRLDESRRRVLYEYSGLFSAEIDPGDVTQLTAVRPLMDLASKLPRYTQLTESLSKETTAVRDALFSARQPQRLLFEALPQALGFRSLRRTSRVEKYFSQLKYALLELQRAYEQLLLSIQRELVDALLLPAHLEAARREIAPRVKILENYVADLKLKAFLLRLADSQLPDREWLESTAACLVSKPPDKWSDGDALEYRIALADIAGRLRRTEEVALASASTEESRGKTRIFRLGITDGQGREKRQVVRVPADDEERLAAVVSELQKRLDDLEEDRATLVMAVAELARQTLERDPGVQQDDDEAGLIVSPDVVHDTQA